MGKKTAAKLTKAQQDKLDDLISWAKTHGISQEYGVGSQVDSDEKNFEEAKDDMIKLLLRMNKQIAQLKSKLKDKE